MNNLYKQECDHGTSLVFPRKPADKQMHLCDLSSCAPDPAQSSVAWCTKVVTQNMKVFLNGRKNQCWKQLMRRPKVRMAFGLSSNNFIYLFSNTTLCAGCFGNDFILETYCRYGFASLAPKQGSCASTYKLSTGKVRNALRQSLSPWLCMGSSICK